MNCSDDSLTPGTIVKEYVIKVKIGDGSYGEVYKVTKVSEPNGPELVLKEIQLKKCENKSQLEMVKNEAPILSKLKSDYVVHYYDSFEENNNVYIIMEYCEGGDLSHYLSDYKKANQKMMNEDSIWKWFIQISLGLLHIHNNKILHRDLKSLNIFLTKDLNVKIGDLGVAKILKNASHAMTIIGTPYYLSPEICEEKPYNEKSDVWSLGCILYEMIAYKHPFNAGSTPALFIKILNGKFDPLPAYCPTDLRKMIEMLLEKNYYKRLSMKEIIQHPSFQAKAKKLDLVHQLTEAMSSAKEKIKIIKINQVRLNKRAKFQSINNIKSVNVSNKLSPFEISQQKKHYGSDLKDIKVSNSEKKLNLSANKNKAVRNKNPSVEKNNICNSKNQIKAKAVQPTVSVNNVIRFSSVRNNTNNNSVSKDKYILNTSNNSNNSGDELAPVINVNDFLNEISKKSLNSKYDISCFSNEEITKQTANTTALTSNKITNIPTEISAYKESDQTFLPPNSNNELLDKNNNEDGDCNCNNAELIDEANDIDEFFAEAEGQQEDNPRGLLKENIEEMKEKYKSKYNSFYKEFKTYSNCLDCDIIFSLYKEIEDNKSSPEEVIKEIEEYIKKQIPLKYKEFIELFYNLIYYEQQYKNIEEKSIEGK